MVPALGVLRDAEKFGFNVYLSGGPGSGKTTLLRHFEYEFCGAAVFVRAEPAASATELLQAVAVAVGPLGGAAPVSMGDTELDVAAVFDALDRWQDMPGRPRVVLVDGADDEQVRVLFGRYRDSIWDLPLTWMVASRGTGPPPPADSFFDRVARLAPWTSAQLRELVELRIPEWRADWGDEVASILAPASPSRAMLALQALVLSRNPTDTLRSIAAERQRAKGLPRRLRDLYDALNQAGSAHAGDERLLDAVDVSRSRIAHGLNELETMGFVTAERNGRRVLYATNLHLLLLGAAGQEAAGPGAALARVPVSES